VKEACRYGYNGSSALVRDVMSIKIVLKKIKNNLDDYGVRVTLGKCLLYPLRKFYLNATYRIYRRDLRGENLPGPSPAGIVFRVVEDNDIPAIRQIEEIEDWPHALLQGSISKGQGFCVAAFDGPRVIGFNVVALQKFFIAPLKLKLRLLPHRAWSAQITVLKAYRKLGLATALSRRVFAELQKRGIRTLYSSVVVSNAPSLRLHEKLRFRTIADVQYRKVFNRERRIWRRARHAGPLRKQRLQAGRF
jgi:ribosomal protein S18 acetylase RimI-like enzyme